VEAVEDDVGQMGVEVEPPAVLLGLQTGSQ
jgi:hypothetical protein